MGFQKLSSQELRQHKGVSFPGVTTVFVCHDGQGRLLLAKRSKNARDEHGRWDVGGGGLKHGQSIEANLRRELLEEYGVVPLQLDYIGYFDAFRTTPDGHPSHWLTMCFAVLVDPTEAKICEPEMIDELGWFLPDNLPNPMHSQFDIFYKKHGVTLRRLMKKQAAARPTKSAAQAKPAKS